MRTGTVIDTIVRHSASEMAWFFQPIPSQERNDEL